MSRRYLARPRRSVAYAPCGQCGKRGAHRQFAPSYGRGYWVSCRYCRAHAYFDEWPSKERTLEQEAAQLNTPPAVSRRAGERRTT
jgi:hypothetical protein